LEERSLICANALQETKGKEFEIATDYIVSHTLETILQGCDVDHLCDFLQSSANDFPYIAIDRSGSHVAETAIKSLAVHLQHDEARPLVEEALTIICKVECISYLFKICRNQCLYCFPLIVPTLFLGLMFSNYACKLEF